MYSTTLTTQFVRILLILALAATIALSATVGQSALGNLIGVNLTSAAHACQGSGGAGAC